MLWWVHFRLETIFQDSIFFGRSAMKTGEVTDVSKDRISFSFKVQKSHYFPHCSALKIKNLKSFETLATTLNNAISGTG